jgi:hypothetical protein
VNLSHKVRSNHEILPNPKPDRRRTVGAQRTFAKESKEKEKPIIVPTLHTKDNREFALFVPFFKI